MLHDDEDEDPTTRREMEVEMLRRFVDDWLTSPRASFADRACSSGRADGVDIDDLDVQPCQARPAAQDAASVAACAEWLGIPVVIQFVCILASCKVLCRGAKHMPTYMLCTSVSQLQSVLFHTKTDPS